MSTDFQYSFPLCLFITQSRCELPAVLLRPQVTLQPNQTCLSLRPGPSSLVSSACTENTGGGTLTGAPLLVSSQLAVFCYFHICVCCFLCREMWFIYLLSWLSLVIQISFVTLAIGKCMLRIPAGAKLRASYHLLANASGAS